jgi:hypothetical protein
MVFCLVRCYLMSNAIATRSVAHTTATIISVKLLSLDPLDDVAAWTCAGVGVLVRAGRGPCVGHLSFKSKEQCQYVSQSLTIVLR